MNCNRARRVLEERNRLEPIESAAELKGLPLKMRRERRIAKVAMARKLAVRLYWMWRKGWGYSQTVEFGSYAGQLVTGRGVTAPNPTENYEVIDDEVKENETEHSEERAGQQTVQTFSPEDPTGLYDSAPPNFLLDLKSYVYSHTRITSDLYIAMG